MKKTQIALVVMLMGGAVAANACGGECPPPPDPEPTQQPVNITVNVDVNNVADARVIDSGNSRINRSGNSESSVNDSGNSESESQIVDSGNTVDSHNNVDSNNNDAGSNADSSSDSQVSDASNPNDRSTTGTAASGTRSGGTRPTGRSSGTRGQRVATRHSSKPKAGGHTDPCGACLRSRKNEGDIRNIKSDVASMGNAITSLGHGVAMAGIDYVMPPLQSGDFGMSLGASSYDSYSAVGLKAEYRASNRMSRGGSVASSGSDTLATLSVGFTF